MASPTLSGETAPRRAAQRVFSRPRQRLIGFRYPRLNDGGEPCPRGDKAAPVCYGAEAKRSPRTVQDDMSNPEAEVEAAGPLPTSPAALHRRLDDLGLAYRNLSHPPVFPVEEAKPLPRGPPG